MRWLVVALVVVCVAPAPASIVRNISIDEMVLSSTSIVVGVVRKIDHHKGPCTASVTVEYDVERALRGSGGGKGTYHEAWPVFGPGCPGVEFSHYPCRVNWETIRAGERAIFYRGGASGDACDVATREAEIKKLMSKVPTISELVDKLRNDCRTRNCPYLAEIARHGDEALPALKQAILATTPADSTATLVWGVGEIRRPAACTLLKELLALGDHRVRTNDVIAAMGSAGCSVHLPELRKRFAAVAPGGYDAIVLLDALVALRDGKSVALIARRMNDKAWRRDYLSLVLALEKIGDRSAVAPLCARLARGGFARPVDRDVIVEALTALGGKCR
jgi:hypothetical protein